MCCSADGHRLPGGVGASGQAVLLHAAPTGEAEISEASLEIFVQKRIEDGVEAAVGVAQSDAQVPAGYHKGIPAVDLHHGLHNDEYVNGGPADDEGCHHHQDHAGDAAHVAVFLLGAGEQTDTPQTQDHQTVAYGDDHHRDNKSKDKDADLGHGVPVPVRLGELYHARGFT